MTLKNKLRIDYYNWKNRKLKEDNRKRKLEEIEELATFPEAGKKYELETGKSPLTLKDTIRKDYFKWIEMKKQSEYLEFMKNYEEKERKEKESKLEDYNSLPDIEKRYIRETGKPIFNKKRTNISKEFKIWLDKENEKHLLENTFKYKVQTGISAYKKDNKALTEEFHEWYKENGIKLI